MTAKLYDNKELFSNTRSMSGEHWKMIKETIAVKRENIGDLFAMVFRVAAKNNIAHTIEIDANDDSADIVVKIKNDIGLTNRMVLDGQDKWLVDTEGYAGLRELTGCCLAVVESGVINNIKWSKGE